MKKNVNDDVLKNANMSREEYDRFLKAYEQMLKNDRLKPAKETLPAPFKGSAPEANRGIRQVDAVADPKFSAERGGPAVPPPGFQDAYSKFTRGMAGIKGSSDKK